MSNANAAPPFTQKVVGTPPAVPLDGSNAAALLTFADRMGSANTLAVRDRDGIDRPIVILPEGKSLESVKSLLDEYASEPDRITGTATLHDEDSFVRHVKEQKRGETRIFCIATGAQPSMTAVYNYHAIRSNMEYPAFRDHRAHWPFQMSPEWKAWMGQNGKLMSGQEFAEFLEVRVPDVYWGDERNDWIDTMIRTLDLRLASASSLVQLSRNIAVNVDVQVRQAQTLSSGEIALTYVEQHRDGEGAPIRVANAFLVRIPVVLGGPTYLMLARLRYRVGGGKVSWAYDLTRADLVLEAAIKGIVEHVAEETAVPVFLGTPES